jgi:hypothetical protein
VTDERHQGPAALESIFHEAGHALIFPPHRELRTALEEAGKPGHDDLWHALLFFTAGEVVKRQPGPDLPLLEKHWTAVLDGEVTPSERVKALVAAL